MGPGSVCGSYDEVCSGALMVQRYHEAAESICAAGQLKAALQSGHRVFTCDWKDRSVTQTIRWNSVFMIKEGCCHSFVFSLSWRFLFSLITAPTLPKQANFDALPRHLDWQYPEWVTQRETGCPHLGPGAASQVTTLFPRTCSPDFCWVSVCAVFEAVIFCSIQSKDEGCWWGWLIPQSHKPRCRWKPFSA